MVSILRLRPMKVGRGYYTRCTNPAMHYSSGFLHHSYAIVVKSFLSDIQLVKVKYDLLPKPAACR